MARAQCPRCGTSQVVTKSGALRKHRLDTDEVCEDKQSPPPAPAPEPEPTPEPDPEPTPEPDDLGYGKKAYTWRLTVTQPCHYVDDAGWHQANVRMAALKAAEAGLGPSGEGQCTGVETTDEAKLTFVYQVPVA